MVSTRRKSYISPPRVTNSPGEGEEGGQDVNKSADQKPKEESEPPLPSTPKSSSKRKSPKKKKLQVESSTVESIDEVDESPLFIIDKTPDVSTCISGGDGDCEEPVDDNGGGASETVPKTDTSSKSELENDQEMINTAKPMECDEEEVYEIDMTNIKTAADEQLHLEMSESADSNSRSSFESKSSSSELMDKSTAEHEISAEISENGQGDENNDEDSDEDNLYIDNEQVENSNQEKGEEKVEEDSTSQLFVIDKGPSHSKDEGDDDLFMIDKQPMEEKESDADDDSSSESESDDEPPSRPLTSGFKLSSRIKCPIDLNKVSYINFNPLKKNSQYKESMLKARDKKVDELMKKSVLKPGFEKQQGVDAIVGKRQLKRERRAERAKTKGAKWYNMAPPEMTSEVKNDLSVVHMRRALDPKRFYKNNDMEGLPKYFQMGRVVETAADFYHARVPKKQRKANIVEELLADAEFRKFNKRKYSEIQEKKVHHSRSAYKHMKRLKKNKK